MAGVGAVAPVIDDPRRARLAVVADRVRPVALAREQSLPVLDELAGLFPEGGLRRGSTVSVQGPGASALALALAAGASRAGSWAALVDLPELGLAAAAELGVVLERTAVVTPVPPASWGAVVAALVGAFDVVLVDGSARVRDGDARRLAARARERGSVLVRVGAGRAVTLASGRRPAASGWPEGPDLGLEVVSARWDGLGDGHGRLTRRVVTVEATGRRGAARPRRVDLLLPGPGGGLGVVR